MICTSIEQSRRLLELGLDPKTADMFWMDTNSVSPCLKLIDDGIFNHRNYLVRFPNTSLPTWSLSALLEVMPKEIKKDDKQYNFHLETTHNLYYVSYYRYDIDGIRYLHTTEMNNCTIDAAYEMVCWLLWNDLIKKEDKK